MTPACTILYAEDEENDVFFLERAIEAAGLPHDLKAVVDGEQALEYLAGTGPFGDRARYPLPALVLLDINMPKKTGFEVLEWIRQQPRFKSMPVLMFTSSSRPEDFQTALKLGADDCVVKPSTPSYLVELVKSLCDQWLWKAEASKAQS